MKRLGIIAANAIATIAGGWLLANIVMHLPIEMPSVLDNGIRAVLRVSGHNELANPDDMEVLAMLAILLVSVVAVGILVWVANIAVSRMRAHRT